MLGYSEYQVDISLRKFLHGFVSPTCIDKRLDATMLEVNMTVFKFRTENYWNYIEKFLKPHATKNARQCSLIKLRTNLHLGKPYTD